MTQPALCVWSLVFISFACRPTVQSTPSPTTAPKTAFPDTLEGFRFTATDSIPVRDGGGRLYRYSGRPGEYLTVFVYPIPEDVKAAPDSVQWVVMEGRKFGLVMPVQVQRGRYDAYEIAFENPHPVVAGRDTIPGFVAGVATRTRGAVELQMEYLYLVHGRFLKIRATMPEKGWQETRVALFAEELARRAHGAPR